MKMGEGSGLGNKRVTETKLVDIYLCMSENITTKPLTLYF